LVDKLFIGIGCVQVEQDTKFAKYTPGQFPLPTDEITAGMFCMASEVLKAGGMEHYEICSYSKPGYRSALLSDSDFSELKVDGEV
jgi:coproporphyrinogen III oxidase-like Fe-S oxidoreductase